MKFGTKVIIALALLANLWFVSSCNNGPKRELWLDEVYKGITSGPPYQDDQNQS